MNSFQFLMVLIGIIGAATNNPPMVVFAWLFYIIFAFA